MISIGCDIENVDRFKEVLDNREFLSAVFTRNEIRSCLKKKNPEFHLASKFACKESIFKALSALKKNVPLKFIEIIDKTTPSGRARVIRGKIGKRYKILVNVSGTDDIVLASSVIEGC